VTEYHSRGIDLDDLYHLNNKNDLYDRDDPDIIKILKGFKKYIFNIDGDKYIVWDLATKKKKDVKKKYIEQIIQEANSLQEFEQMFGDDDD